MDFNLAQEKASDYQWYQTKGSHFQIGLETAKHSRELIRLADHLSDKQKQFARDCRRVTLEIFPELEEEFAGYAEGFSVTEEELLPHYTLGLEGGCSSIAMKTPEGMFVGRNYDYFYFENRRHLIQTQPDKGYSHTGIHEGLLGGRFDGLNEKGLYISFNGAGDSPKSLKPGLPFHLVVRYILERCSNAKEAKAVLMDVPIIEPKSYMVVDNDDAFVIEAHPDRRACRNMKNNILIATNHYIHPSMMELAERWMNSTKRYDTLWNAGVKFLEDPLDSPISFLKGIMADHEAPLCGHEDGLATFWSCIAGLKEKEISYSLGSPCRNEYKKYFG
jgi:predicted choloylglycine hydrolase